MGTLVLDKTGTLTVGKPSVVASNKRFSGIIGLADTLKAESADVVAELQHEGLKVVMLTGDSERAARVYERVAPNPGRPCHGCEQHYGGE